ncbi:MAG: carboxypeptidase regulatory-like domain-containing protein [Myxococcales bacterium]|nr:carboxypeptidase regulatory-like domain-containing protein [Myxococcales bacterium]
MVACLLLATACTSGGRLDAGGSPMDGAPASDAGSPPPPPDAATCHGTVEGQVRLPNGIHSAAGALVYVAGEAGERPLTGECGQCVAYESVLAHALTDAAGRFELSLPAGTHEIIIQKGGDERRVEASVACDGTTTLATEAVRLPRTVEEGRVPRMAVIDGIYDSMELVLARMGLGELAIDGAGLSVVDPPFDFYFAPVGAIADVPPIPTDEQRSLLRDPERLAAYDIVFISCGAELVEPATPGFAGSLLFEPGVQQNLRDYVENGGRLYVTDLEYTLIEQIWPQAIDFAHGSGDGLSAEPETPYLANRGEGFFETDARVVDTDLLRWLTTNGVAASATIPIQGLVPGWVMMDRHASVVRRWVERDERPLTVSFAAGCGRVVYSSYHLEEGFSRRFSELPIPEEAILAYLIFQIGECIADPELI